MPRAGPRLRPIRPLPSLIRESPKFWANFFIYFLYKYFFEDIKTF